ncbi:MAG: serine/threonine-protein kinase [Isosphaerales bacterium]
MGPRSPCPDQLHLRLFFRAPVSTLEAESVRAHVEECEACRAIVAGLEAGDRIQNTLADQAVDPARRVIPSGDTMEVGRMSNNVAGPEAGDENRNTLADQAVNPALRVIPSADAMDVFRVSDGGAAQGAGDATVCLPIGAAENGVSFQPSDPQVANSEEKSDSDETCFILSGEDSRQTVAADAATVATRREATDGSSSGAATLEGVTVPGYDILEELGRGGMGVVYKARHRRLQRLVALKMVLAGSHVGQVGLARFRAEAEAVAKLLHPNIVQIFETGEHEGRPYFSLEFVEGGSLDKRIAESPTSPRGAARFVETLARAMEVAHQRGIVHRDLKPSNILLAKLGSQSSVIRNRELDSSSLPADHWSRTTMPKIADFGLAKRVGDDSSQTQSGAILGTPSYMAPEQAGGKNREVGPAADIYSLGAILYELLVGRPPFKAGNPIDTVRQVVEQEPVPPRQLEPRVPYDLETICLKCLEKDPARRFTSAVELAEDLRGSWRVTRFSRGRRRPGSVPGSGANAAQPSWRSWESVHWLSSPWCCSSSGTMCHCVASWTWHWPKNVGPGSGSTPRSRSSVCRTWSKRGGSCSTVHGWPWPPAIGRVHGSTWRKH